MVIASQESAVKNSLTVDRLATHSMSFVSFCNVSNGNIFHVTGHSCRQFTGHRRIPRTKASDRALMFSLICAWINGWVNNREAGDLRRHRSYMTSLQWMLLERWQFLWSVKWQLSYIGKCHIYCKSSVSLWGKANKAYNGAPQWKCRVHGRCCTYDYCYISIFIWMDMSVSMPVWFTIYTLHSSLSLLIHWMVLKKHKGTFPFSPRPFYWDGACNGNPSFIER